MMDMVKGVSDMQTAAIGAQISAAVMAKTLNTTADLQKDLVDQLLSKSGIGRTLNIVA
jgi:hypothetical protein